MKGISSCEQNVNYQPRRTDAPPCTWVRQHGLVVYRLDTLLPLVCRFLICQTRGLAKKHVSTAYGVNLWPVSGQW